MDGDDTWVCSQVKKITIFQYQCSKPLWHLKILYLKLKDMGQTTAHARKKQKQ